MTEQIRLLVTPLLDVCFIFQKELQNILWRNIIRRIGSKNEESLNHRYHWPGWRLSGRIPA
jgi:hypothetical protein